MCKAIAYMRCSGESQIHGDTWERQRAAIEKYAAANGIEVVEWFRDEGVTGKMELEGRAGLSACIEYVRTHDVKTVLVEDSTRLARDLIVAEIVVREFQKIRVRVIAASGGVDLTEGDETNPTAKLIRQILAAVSEFERCCIDMTIARGVQTTSASHAKRALGLRSAATSGAPPLKPGSVSLICFSNGKIRNELPRLRRHHRDRQGDVQAAPYAQRWPHAAPGHLPGPAADGARVL